MVSGTWRISGSPDLVILRITRFGHFLDPFLSTSWPSLTPFWPLPNTFKPTHYHFNHIPQIVVKYPLKRGSKRGSKRGHFGPPKGVILTQNHQSQALDPLKKGVPEGVQPIRMDRGVQCTFWHFLVTFKMSVFWPLFFSQNENVKKVTFFVIVFASFIGGKMTPFLTIEKHEKRGQKRGTDFDPPS